MAHSSIRSASLTAALWQNGLFSGLCGLLCLIAPRAVGEFIGTGPAWFYMGLGVGLLIFMMDLVHQATRKRPSALRALATTLADFTWVLASVLLLVFGAGLLSTRGAVVIAVVAIIVLQFGLRQAAGIAAMYREPSAPDKFVYRTTYHANASPESMWAVIADLGSISRYGTNLRDSRLVGEVRQGEGAVRRCVDHDGKSWTETCTVFEPGSHLELSFDTSEPGFPFPVSHMVGGWRVAPENGGTVVEAWWELVSKPRWAAFVLLPLLGRQVEQVFPPLLQNMEAAAQRDKKGAAA